MDIPFVDLRAQYRTVRGEILDAMGAVLESAQFILVKWWSASSATSQTTWG